jgi:hypothetical protein
MFFDLIDLSKLRRAIVYALVFVVLFILQDLFLARVTLFGVSAMLIPSAVVAVGLWEGGVWGGLVGLFAGYFADMGYSEQLIMFTVLFCAMGFFSGVLGRYLLHRGFVSYMALLAVMLSVLTLCQVFPFLFFTDTAPWPVWRTGLLQVLWSLVWAMPLYFPFKSIANHSL